MISAQTTGRGPAVSTATVRRLLRGETLSEGPAATVAYVLAEMDRRPGSDRSTAYWDRFDAKLTDLLDAALAVPPPEAVESDTTSDTDSELAGAVVGGLQDPGAVVTITTNTDHGLPANAASMQQLCEAIFDGVPYGHRVYTLPKNEAARLPSVGELLGRSAMAALSHVVVRYVGIPALTYARGLISTGERRPRAISELLPDVPHAMLIFEGLDNFDSVLRDEDLEVAPLSKNHSVIVVLARNNGPAVIESLNAVAVSRSSDSFDAVADSIVWLSAWQPENLLAAGVRAAPTDPSRRVG